MCDGFRPNSRFTAGENEILKRQACQATRRQLGHCVVKDKNGNYNIGGIKENPDGQVDSSST